MTTAIQHRPMSEILVAQPEPVVKDAQGNPVVSPAAPPPGQPIPAPITLPEKYQGKTVLEVAEMHANAEKELGRTRNELGVQRGLVSDLSQLSRTVNASPTPAPTQEPVTITGDQLINDPVGSVQAILQPQLDAERQRTDEANAESQLGAEAKALETDFGDYGTLVASEGFQSFASRTPSRQQDFMVAATGQGLAQVRAARRLLEDYKDFQSATTPQPGPTPAPIPTTVADATQFITEPGNSAAPVSSKPQLFESDVIALINSDPLKYRSPSFQAELTAAIREKRFVRVS